MYSSFERAIRRSARDSIEEVMNDSCTIGNKARTPKKRLSIDREWEAFKKRGAYPELDEKDEKDILIHTTRITLELSNLCNYAQIHKKCPLNIAGEPEILPKEIVFDVLNFLEKHNFSGQIAFHNYCEPLMDPRLFKFVEYARNACPYADIYICTNGYYLNQVLADELVAAGVSSILVSAYSRSEFERLSKIKIDIPFRVWRAQLDDRLDLYEAKVNDIGKPCFAPLNEIIIAREGCISLCCLDWRRVYRFGNLHEQKFEQVMSSGQLQAVYERLSKGDRFLDLCKRCGWSR